MSRVLLRTFAGTLGGYAAIVVWTVVTFTLLWLLLGQEVAFRPGTTEVSWAWLAGTLPLNFVGGILGGWVAARIGGAIAARPAVLTLILVIFLLGAWLAVSQSLGGGGAVGPTAPAADLGPFEAAAAAEQPTWIAWILPVVGAFGVWLGGRAGRRAPGAPDPVGP